MSRSYPVPTSIALVVALWLAGAGPAAMAQAAPPDDPLGMAAEPESSLLIPAIEIIGFDFLLSNYNRRFSHSSDYDVSVSTIRHNLRGPWVVDNDPFKVNQAAHPYQGSLYHGAARSAGLDYWQASALTFAGSMWWEITGEKTPPSRNDQIASGIAGSFLGEPLFRMARLVLNNSDLPAAWRPWLAAAISPGAGLNRAVFGPRFDGGFSDHDPMYYGRLHLGLTHAVENDFDSSPKFKRNAMQIDFALDYGLPGNPGYTYRRPFDYFAFQVLASTANGVENLSTSGLLYGTDYAMGDTTRGLWGLYANFDYLSPQIFHVSTTSFSLGSTLQWWISQDMALQGTGLAGMGYAAASTSRWAADTPEYHYGAAMRAALALRLISGARASADVSARMVSMGTWSRAAAGRDEISRVDSAFTWRVQGPHAIGVNYVWSHRSAAFPGTPGRRQTLGRVGIYYTLLGRQGFGTVDWRQASPQ
jgi:hypothetical protein